MPMITCARCGHANPAQVHTCGGCGIQLPEPADAGHPRNKIPPVASGIGPARALLAGRIAPMTAFAGIVLLVLAVAAWQLLDSSSRVRHLLALNVASQHQLEQTRTLAGEKDSLLSQLVETTGLITEISQAITAIQSGRGAPVVAESGQPMTTRQARAYLLPKIDSLRLRLNATEGRLGASLDRVHRIPGAEAQLRTQIAEYERTIESVRKLVASQQVQLTALGTEVATLRAENKRLLDAQGQFAAAQTALQDSVAGLKESDNTVYWVAGSKAGLLELGVVVEEGKGKFLVFGSGKNLVPARDPRATDFSPINKRQTAVINLPKPNVRYRILTRQNLSGLANALDRDGHVRGALQISDPASFWAPSTYLILVEDN